MEKGEIAVYGSVVDHKRAGAHRRSDTVAPGPGSGKLARPLVRRRICDRLSLKNPSLQLPVIGTTELPKPALASLNLRDHDFHCKRSSQR